MVLNFGPTFPVPTAVRTQHFMFCRSHPVSPGPALERRSSAESRKSQDGGKHGSICIYMYCRSSDALYPQPPLLPPGAFINKGFQLLRFSGSSSGVPTLISHLLDNDIWVLLGGGIAGFCRHIACLGFSRSFMLQDPLNVYLVANDFSTKTSLNNNVSHPLFSCGLFGSASFSFTARFLRCTETACAVLLCS